MPMAVLEREVSRVEAEAPAAAVSALPTRWKWTGDDLIRMGEVGLLPPEGRYELLDGEVFKVSPPGPPHASQVDGIGSLLDRLCDAQIAHARQEKPIRLSPYFAPQPDVAVVRGPRGTYEERFPEPEEVLLLVEVAESSLEQDRTVKLTAYAEAAIPEYWILNLPEQKLEVYRDPIGGEYRTHLPFRAGDEVMPLHLADAKIPVTQLLGKPA
jgi:Uma2 family endonuclease